MNQMEKYYVEERDGRFYVRCKSDKPLNNFGATDVVVTMKYTREAADKAVAYRNKLAA
jgi:hypothetical protein